MTEFDLLLDVLVALAVGGVVGIEREHRGDPTKVIAGVRTFPLIAASGVLCVRLAQATGNPAILAVGAGVAGAFALALFAARHSMGVTGLTTPAAMFVTYLAGCLIGYDLRIEGMVVGVATALLLVSKRRLHGVAHHLSDEEVMSMVQFVTVAFILFPLTASLKAPLDPWALVGPGRPIDPYNILSIVVFVSGVSFVSFLAMRTVGARRGVEVSGLLGGLVNSEATTTSLAVQARESEDLERPAAVGALLSISTMCVRNLAIAVFADLSLRTAAFMLPALLAMGLAGLGLAWARERRIEDQHGFAARLGNPFALGPAIKFAIAFAAVSALAYGARLALGEWGVYASLLGALVSGGAVVGSVAALAATGQVSVATAGTIAALACVLGAVNKPLILRAANPGMYRRTLAAYALIAVVGLAGLAAGAWLLLRGA